MMRAIVLTGFMGTGKTVVGREIARRLDRRFLDTDDLIEEAAGMTISELFATAGEPRFRELERVAIDKACTVPGAIVATGGGAMLDAANRRRLREAGPVVCLLAGVDVIIERVGGDSTRPLLQGAGVRERIESLLRERNAAYAAADYMIDTSGRSVAAVADAVLDAVAESDLC